MDFGNANVAFNPLPWLSLTSFASPTAPSAAAVDADFYARAFLGTAPGGVDPTTGTISPDALFGALPQDMSSSSSSTGSEHYAFGGEDLALGGARQRGSNASSFSSSTSASSFLFPNNDSSSHRSTRPSTPEDSPYQPPSKTKTPSITITRPTAAKRLRSSAAMANAAIVATARDEEVEDEVQEKTPSGKKKRRPRKMTEKRREQNRLAQKNLRARRAAQYSEYHDRVDVLEKENQELRTLIEALRDENAALRNPGASHLSVPRTSSSAVSILLPSWTTFTATSTPTSPPRRRARSTSSRISNIREKALGARSEEEEDNRSLRLFVGYATSFRPFHRLFLDSLRGILRFYFAAVPRRTVDCK